MTRPVNHGRLPSVTPGGSWPPSAAGSSASAPSLYPQSETGNLFLETRVISPGASWSLPASPARALLCIARDPGAVTQRRGQPGHPEPGAHGTVTDLTAAGYAVKQKRRPPRPPPDPGTPPATITRRPGRHRRRPGPPCRRRRETAADRYGASLRAPEPDGKRRRLVSVPYGEPGKNEPVPATAAQSGRRVVGYAETQAWVADLISDDGGRGRFTRSFARPRRTLHTAATIPPRVTSVPTMPTSVFVHASVSQPMRRACRSRDRTLL